MIKEITCVVCPIGCSMIVSGEVEGIIEIKGNQCKRGAEYGKTEFIHPVRTLTSSVLVKKGEKTLVSVRTDYAIPKEKMVECMQIIQELKVEAPIKMHQVILKNIADTGSDLIATSSIKEGSRR